MDASGEEDVGEDDGDVSMSSVGLLLAEGVAPVPPTPERDEELVRVKEEEERMIAVDKILKRAEISKVRHFYLLPSRS